MKDTKNYLMTLLCTVGILCLLLPVSAGPEGVSALGLISIWKSRNVFRMLSLCLAILALGAAAPVALFGVKRGGQLLAALLALGSAGIVQGLVQVEAGALAMPGLGCWAMTLCALGAAVLCAMSALTGEPATENTGRASRTRNEQEAQTGWEVQTQAGQEAQTFTRGCLFIQCAPFGGASILLEHMQPVTIGIDPSCCNLVVQGAGISRSHCTVTYNAVSGTYLLLDTSTNGTYLDGGQRVPRSYAMELQAGIGFYLAQQENWFGLGEPGLAANKDEL